MQVIKKHISQRIFLYSSRDKEEVLGGSRLALPVGLVAVWCLS
ncbi:MAG: hypothetical protein ABL887_09600 [Nitrosomonas sp.]